MITARSFREIAPDALAIIKAVTALGASLGIKTTAEGVETQAQLDELRAQGCEEIQGYLISRPVTAQAMSIMLGQTPVERGVVREMIRLADHPAAATTLDSSSNASTASTVVAQERLKRTLSSSAG